MKTPRFVLIPALMTMILLMASHAQAQAYTAVVIGVDYPEGCLRLRAGPSTSSPIIGCIGIGSGLTLTGIWSGRWAQISTPQPGWVYGPQIEDAYISPADESIVVVTPPAPYLPYPVIGHPYPGRYGHWRLPRPHRGFRRHRRAHRRMHYRHGHRHKKPGHWRGRSRSGRSVGRVGSPRTRSAIRSGSPISRAGRSLRTLHRRSGAGVSRGRSGTFSRRGAGRRGMGRRGRGRR